MLFNKIHKILNAVISTLFYFFVKKDHHNSMRLIRNLFHVSKSRRNFIQKTRISGRRKSKRW